MHRIAGLALVLLATGCGAQRGEHVYRIPSSAMEPTLHCARPAPGCTADASDLVAVKGYGGSSPQRADIVVFHAPKLSERECGAAGLFVKRVIGLPGETWEERDGVVYVNGQKLNEPYVQPGRRDHETLALKDVPPRGKLTRIPQASYLVLGDNRNSSCDSRRWGLVPRTALVGKVLEIKRGSKRIHLR